MRSFKISGYYPKDMEQVKKHSFKTKSARSLQEHRRSMIFVSCWLLFWKLFWNHIQLPLPQPPVWAYRFSLEGTACCHSHPPTQPHLELQRLCVRKPQPRDLWLFILSPTQPPPIGQKFYCRCSRPGILGPRSPLPLGWRFHVRKGK